MKLNAFELLKIAVGNGTKSEKESAWKELLKNESQTWEDFPEKAKESLLSPIQ